MTRYNVIVRYEGDFGKDFTDIIGLDAKDPSALDCRFKVFDRRDPTEKLETDEVVAADWLMLPVMKEMLHRVVPEQIRGFRPMCADGEEYGLCINTCLAILNRYGFRRDYSPTFINMLRPHFGDIMLYAFRLNNDPKTQSRLFHSAIYNRMDWYRSFEQFMIEYDIFGEDRTR